MKTSQLIIVVVGFITFMALVLTGLLLEERQDTNQMKACMEAGKQWVRDFGDHYECVNG